MKGNPPQSLGFLSPTIAKTRRHHATGDPIFWDNVNQRLRIQEAIGTIRFLYFSSTGALASCGFCSCHKLRLIPSFTR